MRKIIISMVLLTAISAFSARLGAQTKVIAHRGYWNTEGASQNSLASLWKASTLGVYGSEFDVHVTADGVPIVHHDDDIDGRCIEDHDYIEFRSCTLPNGETLPTLFDYLSEGILFPEMKLVLEIKEASTPEKETEAVGKILAVVEELVPDTQIEYISFSLHVVKELLRLRPGIPVAYLNGDLSPAELKELGIPGLDYEIDVMKEHPEWFAEARRLGLYTNVWTVNDPSDMRWLIGLGADFITTDDPVLLQSILAE